MVSLGKEGEEARESRLTDLTESEGVVQLKFDGFVEGKDVLSRGIDLGFLE